MYLRQAGLTRNPTFLYLYCVRCRGQHVASEAPLERKYSRCMPGAKKSRGQWRPRWQRLFYAQISDDLEQGLFKRHCNVPRPSAEIEIARSANFFAVWKRKIKKIENKIFFRLRGQLGVAGQVFVPRRAWTALTDSSTWTPTLFQTQNSFTWTRTRQQNVTDDLGQVAN
jgi:hypothetical protein